MEHMGTQQRKKLSLQEMSKGRYHALKDACELLDPPADPRTLRGWIGDLNIEAYQSPVQGNMVLISHRDLVALAALVGRSVRDDGKIPARRGQEKLVEPTTLEDLRIQHDRQIDMLRNEIEAVKTKRERDIADLEDRHARDMEQLRQEIVLLGRSAGAISKQDTARTPRVSVSTTKREASAPYVPPNQVKPHRLPTDLPEGSISMRSFTLPHGTTRDVMTAAAKRKDIRAISRPYGGDEGRTQYFLDALMQDEAVEWLVKKGLGHRCEHCPHVTA